MDILCCQMPQGGSRESSFLSVELFFLIYFRGIFWGAGDFGEIPGGYCRKGRRPLPSILGWRQECNLLSPPAGPGAGPAAVDVPPLG